jgi:hypothetical protein
MDYHESGFWGSDLAGQSPNSAVLLDERYNSTYGIVDHAGHRVVN